MLEVSELSVEIPLLRGNKPYFTKKMANPSTLGSYTISYSQSPEIIINSALKLTKTKGFDELSSMKIDNLLDIYEEATRIVTRKQSITETPDLTLRETQLLMTATTGMPITYVVNSFNLYKYEINNIRSFLLKLSPINSLVAFDDPRVNRGGLLYAWVRRGKNLGVIAPSNHPGVNMLWMVMTAMKFPLLLRPSEKEGLFSLRYIQSLYEAGLPDNTVFYLPMDKQFSYNFLTKADLGLIFGSEDTIKKFENNSYIKTYGPGRSKIIVDTEYLKMTAGFSTVLQSIYDSVMFDGGRGCINASALIVVGKDSKRVAEEFAVAISERFAKVQPVNVFDPSATLAAFVDGKMAQGLNKLVDMLIGDDIDVTEKIRDSKRLQSNDDVFFLLPTVILCNSKKQSVIFGTELPFPFLTILPIDTYEESLEFINRSLVISLFSDNTQYAKKILQLPFVEKLFLNELTINIRTYEPHEGFITDFLFRAKAYHEKIFIPPEFKEEIVKPIIFPLERETIVASSVFNEYPASTGISVPIQASLSLGASHLFNSQKGNQNNHILAQVGKPQKISSQIVSKDFSKSQVISKNLDDGILSTFKKVIQATQKSIQPPESEQELGMKKAKLILTAFNRMAQANPKASRIPESEQQLVTKEHDLAKLTFAGTDEIILNNPQNFEDEFLPRNEESRNILSVEENHTSYTSDILVSQKDQINEKEVLNKISDLKQKLRDIDNFGNRMEAANLYFEVAKLQLQLNKISEDKYGHFIDDIALNLYRATLRFKMEEKTISLSSIKELILKNPALVEYFENTKLETYLIMKLLDIKTSNNPTS